MRGAQVAFGILLAPLMPRSLWLWMPWPLRYACVFKDTTSPIPELLGLEPLILDRGIGQVGPITVPQFVGDVVAPPPPHHHLEMISRL